MAIRAKARQSSSRRGSPALAGRSNRTRPTRADRPAQRAAERHTVSRKTATFAPTKPSSGISSYAKALRFVNSLNDFERLRIVRYNTQNFDLDRMRTLLKKLGNPQDSF